MSLLSESIRNQIASELLSQNQKFASTYPGDIPKRQPVHTVYGGAHLFKATTARRIGELASQAFQTYARTPEEFTQALGYAADSALARKLHERVQTKLNREAVEDFRIDFEDGFGHRPDAEEDAVAQTAAREVASAMKQKCLPPYIGIRIKPFSEELKSRSLRTLDLFLSELLKETQGAVPENFVVTLPKVTHAGQTTALVRAFEEIERAAKLSEPLKLEFMVETTQSILNAEGICPLLDFVRASGGRCVAAHFGVYDYTACCDITAGFQSMDHPSCDFARHVMKVALAGTGIWLSDGATNIMPVGPHKDTGSLTEAQWAENAKSVHRAWRLAFEHSRHSIRHGFYQGWDLHPAQLPVRYAAAYSSFLESLGETTKRLKNFVDQASKATLVGDIFDDAATGQGLLNFFLRAMNCAAITPSELEETGLTLAEVQTKSFSAIMKKRRAR